MFSLFFATSVDLDTTKTAGVGGAFTLAQFWGPKNSFSPGGMRELPLALPFPELPEDPEGVKE